MIIIANGKFNIYLPHTKFQVNTIYICGDFNILSILRTKVYFTDHKTLENETYFPRHFLSRSIAIYTKFRVHTICESSDIDVW